MTSERRREQDWKENAEWNNLEIIRMNVKGKRKKEACIHRADRLAPECRSDCQMNAGSEEQDGTA